jgi:hypothetical protein
VAHHQLAHPVLVGRGGKVSEKLAYVKG